MHSLARLLGKSALVVKEAKIDKSADCQVKIVARKAGLISWLLSLLGIDSTFTLLVYRDRLESEEGSLSGRINTTIPLVALDTFMSGFTKPVQLVVFAIVSFVAALGMFQNSAGFGVLLLLLAAVFAVLYYLRKSLLLNFSTNGGGGIILIFKRSVIEGVNVNEALAKEVTDLVKENYINQAKS